jgi:SAM-dependent methyltransferase
MAWQRGQPAGGYVAYNPADSTYELPAEQAMVVANEDSPVFLGGAFETIASCYADHDVFVDAFRTGAGVGWQDHDDRLFSDVVRFFRPAYAAHLVGEWLPALDGVVEKLRAGASVADVGCGLGASTVIMAQAFEHSTFAGFDIHEPSIEAARMAACLFDALHDMGDPAVAARRIRQALAPDGTLLLVEPNAGNALEHNLNPVGRTHTACPRSSARQGRWRRKSGWDSERRPVNASWRSCCARPDSPRAAGNRDPFNIILEARP